MMLRKSPLQGMQSLLAAERLDRLHGLAFRLNGQHEAAPDGRAVDENGACPANAVLAADMRSGEPQVVPQKINQREPRLNTRRTLFSVHSDGYRPCRLVCHGTFARSSR